MLRAICLLLLLCRVAQPAEAFRKFVITPIDLKTIVAGTCVTFTAALVNADGNPTTVERDKEIVLTSTAPSSVFYAYFNPSCVEQVKGDRWIMNPAQTQFRFSIREDLFLMPPSQQNIPHEITITVSARGIQTGKQVLAVHTNDCGDGCRESSVKIRTACGKICGGGPGNDGKEKISVDNQAVRKCWRECYETQDKLLTHCEKQDEKYLGGTCNAACNAFCDEHNKACFGTCYFHPDARNTSLGAKCVEKCYQTMEKCLVDVCKN